MTAAALIELVTSAFEADTQREVLVASLSRRGPFGALLKEEKGSVLIQDRDGLVFKDADLYRSWSSPIKKIAAEVVDVKVANVSVLAVRDARGSIEVWLFASHLSDPVHDPAHAIQVDARRANENWTPGQEDWRLVGVPLFRRWTATPAGWERAILVAPTSTRFEPNVPCPHLNDRCFAFAQANLRDRLHLPDLTTAQIREHGVPLAQR